MKVDRRSYRSAGDFGGKRSYRIALRLMGQVIDENIDADFFDTSSCVKKLKTYFLLLHARRGFFRQSARFRLLNAAARHANVIA